MNVNCQCNNQCNSNSLPTGMEYVDHLKSTGGCHELAFNMHIGWLKALGAPPSYTCQQMVSKNCNGQQLMCESGVQPGCTMTTVEVGGASCVFACNMEECDKCVKKAKSGECDANDCLPYIDMSMEGWHWTTDQISVVRTHLKQTFPDMIDLKHMDLHDVSVDEVTQCATNMIVKYFPYETIINEDDEIYTNVTKKINSILYMCVISLSKGKTGDTRGDTTGYTNGSKSDGGGHMKVSIPIIIALSFIGLLLLAIILYKYRLSL